MPQLNNEALDTGESPQLFHKSKQDLYKDTIGVEAILPNLGPEAQRYIEMVTSESYKQVVTRLSRYINRPAQNIQIPELIGLVMSAIQRVGVIQQGHEKALEKMALDVIFELEEFKLFRDLAHKGVIKFDVKLDTPDLSNAITDNDLQPPENEEEGELSNIEGMNMALKDSFEAIGDGALKRKFANMITQGNAVNKLYLYNLASDKLNEIHKDLVNLYGIISTAVQVLYYATPHIKMDKQMVDMAAAGSVEVVPEDEIYVIKARSQYFPYLIHEIVKGMYDYLSMDLINQQGLDQETVDDETIDIMSGPDLYNRLTKNIPLKKARLTPLIYKLLLKRDQDTIKTVLLGGGRAQNIVQELATEAEQMLGEYDDESNKWKD